MLRDWWGLKFFMTYFCKLRAGAVDSHATAGGGNLPIGTSSMSLQALGRGGRIDKVVLRLVETRETVRAACDLINTRYAQKGYGADHQIRSDAYHATFTAEAKGKIVGTITLAVDSVHGLAADSAFSGTLSRFRLQPGVRICELTKFAFDAEVRSRAVMASLFHAVFVYGQRSYGCTDLFIEVNPRHVRFYEVVLGFERIGQVTENKSVGAPAQLMWLKVAKIRQHIDAAAQGALDAGRSLYRLFFPPAQEDEIYERLVASKAVAVCGDREVRLVPAFLTQRERRVNSGFLEQSIRARRKRQNAMGANNSDFAPGALARVTAASRCAFAD